ncbi:hypothetical protein AVEN_273267-1 [Araneus ventricosus]|uniref:Uncharacterized protein n=1 Tax=Araneus ventricosus TaxID=182803 RepID=A0A4Y2I1Y1_ARAVE|nr:hypothetical protein AVEN_273267-1 [Araneus ventricosus]
MSTIISQPIKRAHLSPHGKKLPLDYLWALGVHSLNILNFRRIPGGNLLARCSAKVSDLGQQGSRFCQRAAICVGLAHTKSDVGSKMPFRWCGAEVWSGSSGLGIVLVMCSWFKIN